LLFEGFVDYRFIGHQLKLRHNTLRISTNELRPTMPKVIALVE